MRPVAMAPFFLTRRTWIVALAVAATLFSSAFIPAQSSFRLPMLVFGVATCAMVGGFGVGLGSAICLMVGQAFGLGLALPTNECLVLLITAGSVGYTAHALARKHATTAALQATVQQLVDERVAESAANNRELSVEFTERLRVEESLRIREVAMESMLQGVVISDVRNANAIIYANRGFCKLTGYSLDEVLGRNCRFLQGPDTSRESVLELRKAIREVRSCMVELINYRKDGSTFWNALTITPIFDSQGTCTHFVGIQMDATHFKRIEEQFRQSQKMEAVGHLASGVAHDFNNLLTVINGCSELMKFGMERSDPNRAYVEEIHQAGMRAAGLTRQLLTFSRKSTVQPRVVDLNRVLGELDQLVARLIGANVRKRIELAEGLPRVRIDPGLFEQVVMNLVVNARDAMPNGGELAIQTRSVWILEGDPRLQQGQPPGEYVELNVSDTGTGIDKATLNRLFEPFFTTKPVGKGTGLGLATVYGIVKSSDSYISVASQVGRGTTFTILLPATEGVSESGSELKQFSISPSNPGVETILLVEDEPGVRSLARHALRSQGYQIVEASNGEEALRIAASHPTPIDLLLTDVVMPEMGGRELSERLRIKHPDLRVVYMSGYTDDAVLQHGISQAEMHFLQKPFTMNVLVNKIRGVLDDMPADMATA